MGKRKTRQRAQRRLLRSCHPPETSESKSQEHDFSRERAAKTRVEQSPDGWCYPSLPAELILAILDYLPLEDALNARIINKTWNVLAVDNAKRRLAEWMSKVKHAAPRYLELYYKRTGIVVHKTHDFGYLNDITKSEFTQLGGLSMDFEAENYWSSPADATKFPRRCFPVVRTVQVYLMEFPQQFPGYRGCELCRVEAKELEEE